MSAERPPASKLRALTRRRLRQRDTFWGDADQVVFEPDWGGWTRMPRTIPMIASLLDTPSFGGKHNPGRLYEVLWGYDFGDGFVEISDPALLALEAGYLTSRAERTFNERMQLLVDLKFIRAMPMGLRDFGYVLLLDPHRVLASIREADRDRIPDRWWTAFLARCQAAGIDLERRIPRARTVDERVDEGAP